MKKLLLGNWVARLAWLMMLSWPMTGLLCDDGRRTWEDARPIPTVSQMEFDSLGGLVKVGEWRVSVLDPGIGPCSGSGGILSVNDDKICLEKFNISSSFESQFYRYGGGGCYFSDNDYIFSSDTLVCVDYVLKKYSEIKLNKTIKHTNYFMVSGTHKLKDGYSFRSALASYYIKIDTNGVVDTIPFIHNGEVDRSFNESNIYIRKIVSDSGKYSLCRNDSCHVLGFIDSSTDEIPSVEVYGDQIYVYNTSKLIKWISK